MVWLLWAKKGCQESNPDPQGSVKHNQKLEAAMLSFLVPFSLVPRPKRPRNKPRLLYPQLKPFINCPYLSLCI